MEFYDGEDGLEMIRLIVEEGLTPEEAKERVKPRLLTIPVSDEIVEFCEELESNQD